MPIIDRWLDQAPEKIHALANALVGRELMNSYQSIAEDWWRTLDDLEIATKNYNPDGISIAIEGIELLVACMTIESKHADVLALIDELKTLARSNRAFENGSRDRPTFDSWAITARQLVLEIRSLSEAQVSKTKLADPMKGE